MDDATQKEHTKRIRELQKFIQSQPREITEFDEALVKKLLEKVTVHDDYLEFWFKSGVTISIEM
ncbi:MAG: integrase [Oscillospiraceae bacterium]|nr:integrase [Oscillospiraceae bacterium]